MEIDEETSIYLLGVNLDNKLDFSKSSIGDGGSGPCCAKNPTQKNVPKTPPRKIPVWLEIPRSNPKVKSQGQMPRSNPKVKWETTKNRKKPVLIGKIGKMGNRKNGKV